MYAVVSFDETDETDFLPVSWIPEVTSLSDMQKVIMQQIVMKAYWPLPKVNAAKPKKQCLDPEVTWPVYSARILSIASKLNFNVVLVKFNSFNVLWLRVLCI